MPGEGRRAGDLLGFDFLGSPEVSISCISSSQGRMRYLDRRMGAALKDHRSLWNILCFCVLLGNMGECRTHQRSGVKTGPNFPMSLWAEFLGSLFK